MYRIIVINPSRTTVAEQTVQCHGKPQVREFLQRARMYPGSYTVVRVEKQKGSEWEAVPASYFR
ncbi:MAG: hypothetical protein ACHQX3_01010 [Nitrospirales bacterium]